MEKSEIFELFLRILRQQIKQESVRPFFSSEITQEDVEQLYKLAVHHQLAHLVASAISQVHPIDRSSAIAKRIEYDMMMAVIQSEKRKHAISVFSTLFEQNAIDFVLLKGAVLKGLYPEDWMRSSSDVDVLVKDIEKAEQTLLAAGYTKKGSGSHDIVFISPEKVLVEVHFTLIETDSKVDTVLQDAWKYCELCSGYAHCYEMQPEMFYFYHIAHMAKHFSFGGCGVRYFTDVWLLNTKYKYNAKQKTALLRAGGLVQFAAGVEALSKVWLEGVPHTDLTYAMAQFVVRGGIYGSKDNYVKISKAQKSNAFSYWVYRIFMPYGEMKLAYPILSKLPFLLPIYWVIRAVSVVFNPKRRYALKYEAQKTKNNTDDVKTVDSMMQKLGLK